MVEIARRFHGATAGIASDDPVLARLRAWLRACELAPTCGQADLSPDRVPLPGPPAFWLDTVFEGRVAPDRLMLAILDRRDTALLYTALLSMREEVRAWLLARPGFVKQLLPADVGALVVAAPHLRFEAGRWQLPGGPPALSTWAALAAVRVDDPEAWLLGLLRAQDGLVTYLMEVVDGLPPPQQQAALALGATQGSRRITAGVELLEALRAAAHGWRVRERPFARPPIDPAFLLSQIGVRPDGGLALPGGRRFWSFVFGGGDLVPDDDDAGDAWREAPPVSAGWIVGRIWTTEVADHGMRYEQVLFATRWLATADAAHAVDVVTALRGYARYPQLLRVLDRIGVADVARVAALVRRADALAQGGADWRSRAAILRWQCLLTFLDVMARTGSIEPDELDRALDALAGGGDARTTRAARVRATIAGLGIDATVADVMTRSLERALVARLTRSRLAAGRHVTWEGQEYRVDIGAAERDRLARVRGRDALPRLDAALASLALADAKAVAPDAAASLDALAAAARLDRPAAPDEEWAREARIALAAARRLLTSGGGRGDAARLRSALEDLGEALATDACLELAYALDMGWAEDLPLTALAAARRHTFTKASPMGVIDASWQAPEVIFGRGEPWHVAGSLLGLDDALAPTVLRRPSLKPLAAAPSLNTGDRRWLVSTAAGLDRRLFTDEAQAELVTLVTRGRARLRQAQSSDAAREAAEQAGADPLRQTLAAWLAQVNPGAVGDVFSMTDIVRLGADGGAIPAALAAWGNVQTPVSGRLAAGPLPSLPWERYAGRSTRVIACALPDLQLALAVGLAALKLPAMLVPDLMPSATFELVNTSEPRHADDFDALAEHVRRLDVAAVERHLGLLTTAGPLRAGPESRTP